VLGDWTKDISQGLLSKQQIHDLLFSRLQVTYNTANSQFRAGSGLDWFWYTNTHDTVNRKVTDLLN
jgi:hypothetical protein